MVINKIKRLFPLVELQNTIFFTRYSSNMANPIVTVKEGKLRGSQQKSIDGTNYYSFKGIPYAQPPIGKLRFKDPLPHQPWEGTRDAVEHGSVCPHFDMNMREIRAGSEDCLFLNVYTKSLDPKTRQPVMFFIHGGGFMFGSGDSDVYGPDFLLKHNVVLVTINYRLEVFGFLCLDTPEVPGNAGMKDQVFALKWVQNNIGQFGGDKDNVTIFGESAGSASVTYHLISPMSKGLFHKAIAQSGTCTMDWAKGVDGRNRAFRVCKALGRETIDPIQALEFLQNVPAKDLVRKTFKSLTKDEENRGLPLQFIPVIEKYRQNAFLNENIEDVLTKGEFQRIPLLIGYNSLEGLLAVPIEFRKLDYRNKIPSSFVPRLICQNIPSEKLAEFGKRIKEFYCKGSDWTEEDVQKILTLLSDVYFVYQTHLFAHYYAKVTDTIFMYRFDFDTELNFFKSLMGFNVEGASHADELFYIFSNNMNKHNYKEKPKLQETVHQVSKMWTDFAKSGNPILNSPNIKWEPYSVNGKEYLNISDGYLAGSFGDWERVEFWNKLYQEAGLLHISKSKL